MLNRSQTGAKLQIPDYRHTHFDSHVSKSKVCFQTSPLLAVLSSTSRPLAMPARCSSRTPCSQGLPAQQSSNEADNLKTVRYRQQRWRGGVPTTLTLPRARGTCAEFALRASLLGHRTHACARSPKATILERNTHMSVSRGLRRQLGFDATVGPAGTCVHGPHCTASLDSAVEEDLPHTSTHQSRTRHSREPRSSAGRSHPVHLSARRAGSTITLIRVPNSAPPSSPPTIFDRQGCGGGGGRVPGGRGQSGWRNGCEGTRKSPGRF